MRLMRLALLFVSLGIALSCDDSSEAGPEGDAGPGGAFAQEDQEHTNIGFDVDDDTSIGPGASAAYAPEVGQSEGITVDDDGRLILSDDLSSERNDLWVANAKEGTISRVDTGRLVEEGRYHVGTSAEADPSRTTVDLAGDMFVGNRKDGSVTKIASSHTRCVDRNQNGIIETSTDHTPLPREDGEDGESTDECVLWTYQFAERGDLPEGSNRFCEGPRGMAATAERGEDFEYNGHVWIGCRDSNTIHKLNGETGELIVSYGPFDGEDGRANVSPYGFVLDDDGRLWISGKGGSGDEGVYWMDVETGDIHDVSEGGPKPYGIALGPNGDIWIAENNGTVWRYTPGGADDLTGGEWASLEVTDKFKGIAVDRDGYVWVVDNGGDADIWLIDPATFPAEGSKQGVFIGDYSGARAEGGMGVAVDFSGHVWGVSKKGCGDNGCAYRFTVDRRDGEVPTIGLEYDAVEVGEGPYSYSDMIGYNLRHFATREGWYRQRFSACPGQSTKWSQVGFLASLPAGTRFVIRAKVADSEEALATMPFTTIVRVPPDTSPIDLPESLGLGHFIELEVHLYAERGGRSPAVGTIGFSFECVGELDQTFVDSK